MKTLQNTIAAIALATLLFSSNVFAQRRASQTANVSISIWKGLSLSASGSIAFPYGVTGLGENLVVAPADGAKFIIDGGAGRNVNLTYSTGFNLSNAGSTLPFTTNLTANSTDDVASASAPAGDVVTLNVTGDYYIYVGGSVNTAGAVEGDYTGTFTLDIAY